MSTTITQRSLYSLILLVVLFSGRTFAEIPPLTPFHATYEVITDGPVSMKGESERVLSVTGERWRFSSSASALFASIEESSEFLLENGTIQPQNYLYSRKVLGKKRSASLDFDWTAKSVVNNVNNNPWSMDIVPGTQDKLSYQLQLQRDVAAGKRSFTYRVADGGSLKRYRFAVKGEEEIETPAGKFQAIRVERVYASQKERKTLVWFAPELNYQLVKMFRQEKKDNTYQLTLSRIK